MTHRPLDAPLQAPLHAPLCPLCGQPNACAASAAGSFDVACWCRDVRFTASALAAVPAELQRKACICRACAGREHADRSPPRPAA